MTSPLASLPRPVLLDLLAEMGEPVGFASPEHEAFWASREPEVLASGWMGAGKSRILCQKAWRIAMTYPGVTVGLFRKTHASIAATTERTWERDVVDHRFLARGHAGRNKSEHWWGLHNGSRVYFLGLDPDPITGVPSKVGSLDLGWAGVDEAVEVTEGDWIMLLGRLRDPRMPWHQLAGATNPGPPGHWLRKRMLAADAIITIRSNRFLSDWYLGMLSALPDSAIGRRLGRGEWAAVEGTIWHIDGSMIRPPDAPPKRVVAGIDWGYVHAFALEIVGQSGSGRLTVRAELYAKGRGLDEVAPSVAKMCEDHDVQTVACDPSEPGLMAQLRRAFAAHRAGHADCKLRATLTPARTDVLMGIGVVDRALRDGMTIDPSCTGLLGEMPGYTWAPDRLGGFHERPVEVGDDACDALRYAVMALEPDPKDPWAALTAAQTGGVA